MRQSKIGEFGKYTGEWCQPDEGMVTVFTNS